MTNVILDIQVQTAICVTMDTTVQTVYAASVTVVGKRTLTKYQYANLRLVDASHVLEGPQVLTVRTVRKVMSET